MKYVYFSCQTKTNLIPCQSTTTCSLNNVLNLKLTYVCYIVFSTVSLCSQLVTRCKCAVFWWLLPYCIHAIFNFPLSLIQCRVWIGPIVKLDPDYIGVYIGVYILYGSRVISASVIMAVIMNLLMSDNILLSTSELAILENMIVSFGISILSCLQAEIYVYGLAAAILDFWLPLTSDNILLSAIELAILENMVCAFGISILLCLQAEIHALPV